MLVCTKMCCGCMSVGCRHVNFVCVCLCLCARLPVCDFPGSGSFPEVLSKVGIFRLVFFGGSLRLRYYTTGMVLRITCHFLKPGLFFIFNRFSTYHNEYVSKNIRRGNIFAGEKFRHFSPTNFSTSETYSLIFFYNI